MSEHNVPAPNQLFPLRNVGFDQFIECSQDGKYDETDVADSCALYYHREHNAFFRRPVDGSFCALQDADLRAK